MEAQTDVQTYMENGKQALAMGQARDAAIAYAHAAQMEPNNPAVHLGLAEANLALGSYGVVHMACRKVQELQPDGGFESLMAQALLDTLDHRYERALQDVDKAIELNPGIGYAHALRAYLLRLNGQDYDAGLARSRIRSPLSWWSLREYIPRRGTRGKSWLHWPLITGLANAAQWPE